MLAQPHICVALRRDERLVRHVLGGGGGDGGAAAVEEHAQVHVKGGAAVSYTHLTLPTICSV
eukprot:758399-Prymnesium_polylepis.2